MKDALFDEQADALLKELGLPPCPAILTRIMKEARAEEPDFGRISALISHDVSLAAALLSTVNSAAYGLEQKVASIQKALMLLGLRTSTTLVTGLALRAAFPGGNDPLFLRFWSASARAASLASLVAGETRAVQRDVAHTFALFRDCGMLLLAQRDPRYADALKKAPFFGTRALVELERQQFVVDHPTIGCHLARDWGLGEDVQWAIRLHHDYADLGDPSNPNEKLGQRLIAVGLAADWLSAQVDGKPHPDWTEAAIFVQHVLSLDESDLGELVDLARQLAKG